MFDRLRQWAQRCMAKHSVNPDVDDYVEECLQRERETAAVESATAQKGEGNG